MGGGQIILVFELFTGRPLSHTGSPHTYRVVRPLLGHLHEALSNHRHHVIQQPLCECRAPETSSSETGSCGLG